MFCHNLFPIFEALDYIYTLNERLSSFFSLSVTYVTEEALQRFFQSFAQRQLIVKKLVKSNLEKNVFPETRGK